MTDEAKIALLRRALIVAYPWVQGDSTACNTIRDALQRTAPKAQEPMRYATHDDLDEVPADGGIVG
jgi:hypothetical protein